MPHAHHDGPFTITLKSDKFHHILITLGFQTVHSTISFFACYGTINVQFQFASTALICSTLFSVFILSFNNLLETIFRVFIHVVEEPKPRIDPRTTCLSAALGIILYTVCAIVLTLGKHKIPSVALLLAGIILFAAELLSMAYVSGVCRKYLTLKNRHPQQEPQENKRYNDSHQTESKDIVKQNELPKEAAQEETDNRKDVKNNETKNEK
uniref:Uncharacterized protein n=1 Tax=Cacopsylla melanoneura TaxID=428564 RepID=A0A8D9BCI3_9HEMI